MQYVNTDDSYLAHQFIINVWQGKVYMQTHCSHPSSKEETDATSRCQKTLLAID